MKIKIIFPSRSRPELAMCAFYRWVDNADALPIDVVFSLDRDDPLLEQYKEYAEKCGFAYLISGNKNAVEAINIAASYIESCSLPADDYLLVVASDDFSVPKRWDTLLLKELEDKSDFLLKTNDGLQPTLVTLPIMDRKYYNRFGYVYEPGYAHMFCDQEMTSVALMTGRYIKSDLYFPHNHYSTGKFKKDEISKRNDATWQQGERLFNQRLKTNFGIKEPVMKYSDIVWH